MSKTPKNTQTPLELFQTAYKQMHGKHTKYTTMNLARPKYYKAHEIGTLDAYLAVARDVLIAHAEEKSDICHAKKKIAKAVNMCVMQGMLVPSATADASPVAGGRAMPAVEISEHVAAAYAEQAAAATGGGLRVLPAIAQGGAASPAPFVPPPQRSPLDKVLILTSAPPREAPAQESTLAGAQRVVMSASARFVDGVRVFMSAGKEQARTPTTDVGQKRLFHEETYTDRPTKTQAVGAAGGKAPAEQARAEVVYAKMHDVWHEKVVAAMRELECRDIFKFEWFFVDADNELSTLTPDKAVACLEIMRNFKTDGHITNANHHFVSKARLMRKLYDLDAAADILQEMKTKKRESDAADQQTFAWDFSQQGWGWRKEVADAMKLTLPKTGGFVDLNEEAFDQLRTLPLYTALMLFNKFRAEEKMKNISAFIVENAQRIRHQYGLDEVQTILDANKGYDETHDDGTETEDDDEKAAAPEIKKEKEAKAEVKIKEEKEDNAEVKIKQEKKDDDVIEIYD
jgi:hypothetical protein